MTQVEPGSLAPPRIQYSPRGILIPLMLAALLLLFPDILVDAPATVAAWVTVICVVWLVVAGYRRSRLVGENPWVSPLFIHMLYVFFLQYGIGLLFVLYGEFTAEYMGWDPIGPLELLPALGRSSWLIIAGALGTYIGLLLPVSAISRRLPGLIWDEDARRFPIRAVLLFPLIFGAYAYSVSDFALDEIQQTAYIVGTFGLVLMVCGFVRVVRGTRHPNVWRTVIISAVLGYVVVGLFFGSRGTLVQVLVFLVWSILAVRRTTPWKWVAGLTLGLVLFGVYVFPYLSYYKYYRAGGLVPLGEAMEAATQEYRQSGDELKLEGLVDFLKSLTFQATYVASYQQTTPSPNPFLWGESARVILSTIVPRVLNPAKPNAVAYVQELAYRAGLFTDATYYGVLEEGGARGAISIDYISEFYINFGPWGVLLLSILQGVYLRVRYEWLIRHSRFEFGFPMYAIGFLSASALWHVFVLDIKNWFIWTPLLWVCSRRSTR